MPKKKKLRDILLERNLCDSLSHANSLILSGSVLVNEQKITKSGFLVKEDSMIRILEKISKRVSRGAYKLEKAISHFSISIEGKICLDFGASTGGFTEILIEKKAKKIYAFDVGYGQLAGKIRNHPGVVVRDKFNVRMISKQDIEENPQELIIVIDLSFVSLIGIFDSILKLKNTMENTNFYILSLIKPQFECNRRYLDKGIVKDPKIHFQVLKKIGKYIQLNGNFYGFCHSPIKGMDGNKEFFVYWSPS